MNMYHYLLSDKFTILASDSGNKVFISCSRKYFT